jgi:hypothetical protein
MAEPRRDDGDSQVSYKCRYISGDFVQEYSVRVNGVCEDSALM